MIRTLIVDDESILRVTMRSLINWERRGYTIVADCTSGLQALDYLQTHTVDLLITDMKMPGMTGLELLARLREGSRLPVTVVLSGYNEFELVREAFRLGAYDYMLKEALNEASLGKLLDTLRQKIFTHVQLPASKGQGSEADPFAPSEGDYVAVAFAIDDFTAQATRFGSDLHEKLEKPMLELARQIPRLNGRAVIRAAGPSLYELCYRVKDRVQAPGTIQSIVQQVQAVWRDYMNLSVSAAISDVAPAAGVPAALTFCKALIKLAVLQGKACVLTQRRGQALVEACGRHAALCDGVVTALCGGETAPIEQNKQRFFEQLEQLPGPGQTLLGLALIARTGEKLQEYGQDFFELFPEEEDYEKTLAALGTAKEKELWLRNWLRRVQAYFAGRYRQHQPDAIKRARLFMEDNYTNPELTLRTVADYVGFNEKYFSTRFTKECGCTFITFLNQLRLQRAQQLLTQTDLKIYEISDYVGYSNVEHFNHTFKKKLGISPSDYRNHAVKPNDLSRNQT